MPPVFLTKGFNMIIMSVDYGDARTGVAFCDKSEILASPYTVVKETYLPKLATKLSDIAAEKHAEKIIVGLPVNMDGTYGYRCDECKKLGVETDFVEINWDAKENELNSKKVDCLWNGLTITPDRKENMSITDAYLGNKQVMVTSKDNVEKYGKDITDARVVAETGSAGEELATGNDFFKTAKFAVVDYVTSIGSIGEGTDYTDLAVVTAQEFEPEEYGIAFRKGSDITEKVNAAMKELAADGTLLKIAEKYKLQDLLLIK